MISYWLNNILPYLWAWGTSIFATLLFIIMVRIWFAFVLKLFRMNIDYNTSVVKRRKSRDAKSESDFYEWLRD